MDLLQMEHLKILVGIGVGTEKVAFSVQKTLICLKCGKIN